jgi:hypothetical protein
MGESPKKTEAKNQNEKPGNRNYPAERKRKDPEREKPCVVPTALGKEPDVAAEQNQTRIPDPTQKDQLLHRVECLPTDGEGDHCAAASRSSEGPGNE